MLRRADQAGVAHRIGPVQIDRLAALLDQSLHRLAGFRPGRSDEVFEYPFQARHMRLGFLPMLRKTLLQSGIRSGLGHFRERLHQLFFGIVDVFDFFGQEIAEGID